MTECAKCGDCCDPVIVTFDPQVYAAEQLARRDPPGGAPEWVRYQYQFFLDHWTSQSSRVDADGVTVHHVRCDQFDRTTRTCLAHDRQPQVCSGYPWYGREEGDENRRPAEKALSPRCSFNADVPGRRMLPLEVIHGRR